MAPDMAVQQIRARHPYAFRSGQWADLLSITRHASDFWPVDDAMAHYEFREKARNV